MDPVQPESEDLFAETPMEQEEVGESEILENTEEISETEEPTSEDVPDASEPTEEADKENAVPVPAAKKLPIEPRMVSLPLARVKNIMKLDSDFNLASGEAVFLVTKATEMFIQSLARESYIHTAQAKKKTIQKRDVDQAFSSVDSLSFLEGAINF